MDIKILLSADDKLLAALNNIGDAFKTAINPVLKEPKKEPKQQETKPAEKTIQQGPSVEGKPIVNDLTKTPENKFTIETVRALANTKQGEKKDVRGLLDKFEVKGLTKLKVEQYPSFMDELNKL